MKRRKLKTKNKEIIEYLKDFTEIIEKFYNLNCVILFGSQARGDFMPHSDIDLIFVGDFKDKFTKRGDIIYEKYNWKYGLDAFCYTTQEFDKMFCKGVISILDAIDEGICLLGQDFFNRYKKKIEILKERGLRKESPVWILPKSMIVE